MKLLMLAACAAGMVIAMALFVHFTPRQSAAEYADTSSVRSPGPSTDHVQPNVPVAERPKPQPALSFKGVEYHHRSSQSNESIDLHEFTPTGQDNLSAWTDMVSLIHYRHIKDSEGLTEIANLLLSMYESSGGEILVARGVPGTDGTPAEYLLVGLLFDRGVIEAVFNRVQLHESVGANMMVSRRFYGTTGRDEMTDWLRTHGQTTEDSLMSWNIADLVSAIPQR